MTVKELIEQLSRFDGSEEVCLTVHQYEHASLIASGKLRNVYPDMSRIVLEST